MLTGACRDVPCRFSFSRPVDVSRSPALTKVRDAGDLNGATGDVDFDDLFLVLCNVFEVECIGISLVGAAVRALFDDRRSSGIVAVEALETEVSPATDRPIVPRFV